MRTCPDHVSKAMRAYDPQLDLRWDATRHVWVVYRGGVEQMDYDHEDGSPAMDPLVDEVIGLLRRCDMWRRADEELKAMRQRRRERRYRADRHRDSMLAQAGKEARQSIRIHREGPRAFADLGSNRREYIR